MRSVALTAMAHFYFDVCTDGVTVQDEDGVDLLNAATALLEAVRTAAEMMRDRCADRAEPADVPSSYATAARSRPAS